MMKSGFCQNFSEDIKKINLFYTNEKIDLKIKYKAFKGWEETKPYEQTNGVIKKYANLKYEASDELEIIYSDSYYLSANSKLKIISIYSYKNEYISKGSLIEMLDSLSSNIKSLKNIKHANEGDGYGSYSIKMNNPEGSIKQMKIIYNKKNFSISKMIIFYEGIAGMQSMRDKSMQKYKVEVDYYSIDINPDFNRADFTYSKYLHKNPAGKLVCNTKYIGYKLNNYLYEKN